MPLQRFHPVIQDWFRGRFAGPTDAQRLGWPHIAAGRHTLISAPTGSGKTMAAFLACIDQLLRQGAVGALADETQVVYVSPLKALSNDIRRNLAVPLEQIRESARNAGVELPPIRAALRTGDTSAAERQALLKRPAHILVTTPESLYLLLTAEKGRGMLRSTRTIIVDEIHALARDKRGSHLALSLERLAALCAKPPLRIGLSATARPMQEIARFLVGSRNVDAEGVPRCEIVDVGHARALDLAVEVPAAELSAVCSHETWQEIYRQVADQVQSHRSTLVFVNTRRLAERVCHQLTELLGESAVASHHGSLSRETRLSAERRLQEGQLKAIVATSSLELGIDVGFIDLVCQVGSPRSIATFLQRVGRSGHSLGALPRGRLFPLTREELIECLALVRAVRLGQLDQVEIPHKPLDILAQQIVAAVACEDSKEEELLELCRGAWPFRDLSREDFEATVRMLSEGTRRGVRQGAWLHRDRGEGSLRARRGARLAALTGGGAIPEMADYRVVTREDRTLVGTVNEDFAIESLAGDIFLLGNTSWRICHVRGGEVVVEDAQAAPASIPFWLGEAPGRTAELSSQVSRLRQELAARLPAVNGGTTPQVANAAEGLTGSAVTWLRSECGCENWAAEQASTYIAAQVAAIGLVPTQEQIVFERFFDESGGMQLVIHAPFGVRVNRAWGLALRKRFCRTFDFELQASADDNGIALSLGPQHSFPLESMFRMLNTQNALSLLTQALLAVPLFKVRWRWNATRALAIPRWRGGKKVPPHMQRFNADDLLASVFPAQTACLENVVGDIPIPDHPLVAQTVHDCLHEAMDVDRWLSLIGQVEQSRVTLVPRETREPSPFSYELLNAHPYAFLDGAPLEERRARAVATRRTLDLDELGDLGWLDPAAIERVRDEAWPIVRSADELYDTLVSLLALCEADGAAWSSHFDELLAAGRGTRLIREHRPTLWLASECIPQARAVFPNGRLVPDVAPSSPPREECDPAACLQAIVRGQLECRGPQTAQEIATRMGLDTSPVEAALESLEGEGTILRGRFSLDGQGLVQPSEVQWCDRRLLSRIHRLTLESARSRVQPVSRGVFWQFLTVHQHLASGHALEGRAGLLEVLLQLQGCELCAGAWERDVLPGRMLDYESGWLDEVSLSGEVAWGRLNPPPSAAKPKQRSQTLSRMIPISLMARQDLGWLLPAAREEPAHDLRSGALDVYEALSRQGALFFHDLQAICSLLPSQLEASLGELCAAGLVTCDGFGAIRSLISTDTGRGGKPAWAPRHAASNPRPARGGRWSMFAARVPRAPESERRERWAWQLLRRYGVVFRDLLAREVSSPPWRELASVYRRLEAQGRIRGGRFVADVGGEQFATNEALTQLRQLREQGPTGAWVIVSTADPLNLAGILCDGPRLPARPRNALALLDGRLVATQQASQIEFTEDLGVALTEEIRRALRVTAVVRQHALALTPAPITGA